MCFNPEIIKKNGKSYGNQNIVLHNQNIKCACANKCLNSNNCTYFEVIRYSNACSLYQYNFNQNDVDEGKDLIVNSTIGCGFKKKELFLN